MNDDGFVAGVNNRFSGDWIALHMISTVCRLTDQRNASYQFLRNGGMAFAKTLSALKAEHLASAARMVDSSSGDSMQQFCNTPACQRLSRMLCKPCRAHRPQSWAQTAIADSAGTKALLTWRRLGRLSFF